MSCSCGGLLRDHALPSASGASTATVGNVRAPTTYRGATADNGATSHNRAAAVIAAAAILVVRVTTATAIGSAADDGAPPHNGSPAINGSSPANRSAAMAAASHPDLHHLTVGAKRFRGRDWFPLSTKRESAVLHVTIQLS